MNALVDLVAADPLLLGPIGNRQIEVQGGLHLRVEAGDVPGFRIGIGRNVLGDDLVDDIGAHVGDGLLERVHRHHLAALLEHDLALVVHHVVVFEDVLAHVEVALLDLLLRLLQRLVDPRMDDGLVLLEPEARQHRIHAVRTEDAHQIVLQRQEEFRAARVALAAGPAAQLVVDAAAFVTFGADDVEAARGNGLFLEGGDFGADRRFRGIALGSGLDVR